MIRLVFDASFGCFFQRFGVVRRRVVGVVRVVVVSAAYLRASPPHRVRVRHAHERSRPQSRERDAAARRRSDARVRQQKRDAAPVAAAGDAHAQTGGVLAEHVRVKERDGISARARRARAPARRDPGIAIDVCFPRCDRRSPDGDRRRRGGGGDAQLAAVALALEQARRAEVRDLDAPARDLGASAARRRAEERVPTRQGVAGEHQPPAPREGFGTVGGVPRRRGPGPGPAAVPSARRARVAELDQEKTVANRLGGFPETIRLRVRGNRSALARNAKADHRAHRDDRAAHREAGATLRSRRRGHRRARHRRKRIGDDARRVQGREARHFQKRCFRFRLRFRSA
mmetsp:Transcript_12489/g.53525  ORF Transcript_12489/g.53525 Transcript_12489/m.53525 type:complete len:343 (-) Transcript_12489:812-1840(-)